ncbi:MAG TPA: hypothetical protein VIG99_02100 [Myxococcaceae bacterium]|jgi:hypothetical protein
MPAPEYRILPRDGWFGDPAVPVRVGAPPLEVRQRPAFGLTPMSGWLLCVAGGLFAAAAGAGILTASPFTHAVLLWVALLIGHFAVSYFIWMDPLPAYRYVALPLGVTALWGFTVLSFLLVDTAPVWLGWALVAAGLLGVAAGAVPLWEAWWQPRRALFLHRRHAEA